MPRYRRILPSPRAGALAAASAPAVAPARVPERAASPSPAPEVLALQRDVREILHRYGWRDARFSVLVVSLDQGDTLVAVNPDHPLAPASNLKLYSTAAALHYLGPDFRFSTYLLGTGPVSGGVLHGDLVLYGTGDPTLSGRLLESATAPLRALADTLLARGVREVEGDLVGDGSYFDARWTGPGWTASDLEAWYGAPIGALSFAENMVTVRFTPGAVGERARVSTRPATLGLALENRVRTVRDGSTRVSFQRAGDRLVATGQVRRGGAAERTLPVVDPANSAAAAFGAVLAERGIRVRGEVLTVSDPRRSQVSFSGPRAATGAAQPRILAVHLSPRLEDVVFVTNHVSHNLFADALLKSVGRAARGEGSFGAGAEAVRRMLAGGAGGDTSALWQVDGSGLSHQNRTTARAVVRLLSRMARDPAAASYLESLPVAGSEQGLARMYGTAAAGNLRAKTGTIRGVSSLSGYVRTADGERLIFSILANDVPATGLEKRTEDAIGARLARFSRSSSTELTSTPPPTATGAVAR
jgi:D-alanyl-D-alanine carboxypeptidase/D-alanyl-D-alanine-endopeptidase (penicillin-binding protein 4)